MFFLKNIPDNVAQNLPFISNVISAKQKNLVALGLIYLMTFTRENEFIFTFLMFVYTSNAAADACKIVCISFNEGCKRSENCTLRKQNVTYAFLLSGEKKK